MGKMINHILKNPMGYEGRVGPTQCIKNISQLICD